MKCVLLKDLMKQEMLRESFFLQRIKDTEKLKLCDDIEEYMKREVLPYTPDAEAFFEEKVDVKNPVLKTGAEIIFTRQFYIPSFPEPSSEIEKEFRSLSTNIADMILDLYK